MLTCRDISHTNCRCYNYDVSDSCLPIHGMRSLWKPQLHAVIVSWQVRNRGIDGTEAKQSIEIRKRTVKNNTEKM